MCSHIKGEVVNNDRRAHKICLRINQIRSTGRVKRMDRNGKVAPQNSFSMLCSLMRKCFLMLCSPLNFWNLDHTTLCMQGSGGWARAGIPIQSEPFLSLHLFLPTQRIRVILLVACLPFHIFSTPSLFPHNLLRIGSTIFNLHLQIENTQIYTSQYSWSCVGHWAISPNHIPFLQESLNI
jgi:hypothetical protein